MAKKTNTKQGETSPESIPAAPVAGEVNVAGAAPQGEGNDPGTEDHPNPARAASDVAEAAAKAAAESAANEGKPSPARKSTTSAVKKDDALTALAKGYAKLYPKNKTFHITSDKQVFLDKDKGLADLHQHGLKEGKVTTVTLD